MKRQSVSTIIVVAALVLAGTSMLRAQELEADLRGEVEELKKGQQQILRQLQEIKQLVQPRPAAGRPSGPDVKGKTFDLGDNPIKGVDTAKLTLVEFTDYQ